MAFANFGLPTLLTAVIGASALHAGDYRISTFISQSDTHTKEGLIWFADEVRSVSDGDISFEVFTGGALLPAKSTMQGIADGVAQLGFVYSGYTPSELPVSNALTGMAFVETDPIVLGMSFADFLMHEEIGFNDYRHNGIIPVGGFGTAPSVFICNTEPLTSLGDLKGKRVRFPGSFVSQLGEHLGVVPVNVPAPEIYQALQSGQIDCATIHPSWLNMDGSLSEVSKSVLLMNIAPNFASPAHAYDADFWQGLTTEERQTLLDVAARTMARMEIGYLEPQQRALDMAEAGGIVITEPDSTITEAIAAWVADGVGGMDKVARETHGIDDPEALFTTFRKYLDKWRPIVAALEDRNDEDALTAMIKTHLIDTVDAATYGMN